MSFGKILKSERIAVEREWKTTTNKQTAWLLCQTENTNGNRFITFSMFSVIAQAHFRYKQSDAAKRAFKLPPHTTVMWNIDLNCIYLSFVFCFLSMCCVTILKKLLPQCCWVLTVHLIGQKVSIAGFHLTAWCAILQTNKKTSQGKMWVWKKLKYLKRFHTCMRWVLDELIKQYFTHLKWNLGHVTWH